MLEKIRLFPGIEFVVSEDLPHDEPVRQLNSRTFEIRPEAKRVLDSIPSICRMLASAFNAIGKSMHQAAERMKLFADEANSLPPEDHDF